QIFQPEHADSPLLQIAPKIRITVAATQAAQDLRRVLLTLFKNPVLAISATLQE
ncbi:TPA: hypothetical protein QIT77_003043, partial [Klebsiella pneumoniae]|nr:hypothetical protein [Klebsiella pneumoniae]